jgi:MFS family permease
MTLKSRPISVINPTDYMCGFGSWRPKFIQKFASPRIFLLIFGIIGVLQGAAFTYMIASVSTLEKRYAFSSKISGLILIADNVMELITNPLFGYLANRVHRPRMIGFCQIIVVLGCYLAALPYFIYGPGLKLVGNNFSKNETFEFCDSKRDIDSVCDENESNTVIPAVVILWLASCCNGIGFTAFYIIGFPFIDDNVKKKNSALYLSKNSVFILKFHGL